MAVLAHHQVFNARVGEVVGQAPGDAVYIILHGGGHRQAALAEVPQQQVDVVDRLLEDP